MRRVNANVRVGVVRNQLPIRATGPTDRLPILVRGGGPIGLWAGSSVFDVNVAGSGSMWSASLSSKVTRMGLPLSFAPTGWPMNGRAGSVSVLVDAPSNN
jgi:hypothetical protein